MASDLQSDLCLLGTINDDFLKILVDVLGQFLVRLGLKTLSFLLLRLSFASCVGFASLPWFHLLEVLRHFCSLFISIKLIIKVRANKSIKLIRIKIGGALGLKVNLVYSVHKNDH